MVEPCRSFPINLGLAPCGSPSCTRKSATANASIAVVFQKSQPRRNRSYATPTRSTRIECVRQNYLRIIFCNPASTPTRSIFAFPAVQMSIRSRTLLLAIARDIASTSPPRLYLCCAATHIPARLVVGYKGGEFNGVGNYLLVRQNDAHAWVEVHLEPDEIDSLNIPGWALPRLGRLVSTGPHARLKRSRGRRSLSSRDMGSILGLRRVYLERLHPRHGDRPATTGGPMNRSPRIGASGPAKWLDFRLWPRRFAEVMRWMHARLLANPFALRGASRLIRTGRLGSFAGVGPLASDNGGRIAIGCWETLGRRSRRLCDSVARPPFDHPLRSMIDSSDCWRERAKSALPE
jgi:hypothetical protein